MYDVDTNPLNSWDDTDGHHDNPGGGAWTSNAVDFVFSQSWHLGYAFWTGAPFNKSYNPFVQGEYDIRLTISDTSGQLVQSSITAKAVPLPSAAVAGVGRAGHRGHRRGPSSPSVVSQRVNGWGGRRGANCLAATAIDNA